MPTARELLEQADALMRRQREPGEPRVPRDEADNPTQGPATDALHDSAAPARADAPPASADEARETLARMPSAAGTLASMRWSAPLPPVGTTTTSPVFAPPSAASPRTIQREPIAPSVARTALPVDPTESPMFPPSEGGVQVPASDEDIPVLTDAVAEDVFAPLDDAGPPVLTEAIEAAPEEPILEDGDEPSVWDPLAGGPPSISGRGPDSTAVVPPPDTPRVPPDAADPLGLDRPPPGFAPPRTAQWTSIASPVPAAAIAPAEATLLLPEGSPPASEPAAGVAPMLAPLDDARVREIAEEIGMQVLQRIDIFTDTELRTRLGERLKPVVERVSAELVAAINQHVGELLRAYVAEAIEREIDGWRNRQV